MIGKIFLGRNNGVLGINRRNVDYVYTGNSRRYFRLVDRKLMTKEILENAGLPVPETFTVFSNFSELKDLEKRLDKLENFVIKPNKGRGGMGIMICGVRIDGGYVGPSGNVVSLNVIRKQIADIIFGSYSYGMSDEAIIEKRLFPDKFFSDLYPSGLADIRIISYRNNPVMAMMRLPASSSAGRANLHQGGVGVGIDMDTGETISAVFRGKEVCCHPDSGMELLGLSVPCFNEMLRMCANFPSDIPLNYLGFDFAVDEKRGPVILEVNARPGLAIQNANNKGLLKILTEIDKYEK